ncbi:transmembrane protein, putative [Medicago truncatula]|uniref:Transmembrane protein, putative n=1 Tax=Medicago truncatula TaxID=3880 RepID=G7IB11_MEDTR|nr:transmembrane protein, putative [Medicago truncatula]
MVENRLREFEYVERRPIDCVIRRVDQIENNKINIGWYWFFRCWILNGGGWLADVVFLHPHSVIGDVVGCFGCRIPCGSGRFIRQIRSTAHSPSLFCNSEFALPCGFIGLYWIGVCFGFVVSRLSFCLTWECVDLKESLMLVAVFARWLMVFVQLRLSDQLRSSADQINDFGVVNVANLETWVFRKLNYSRMCRL